ncbi:hypothetical protein POJ06DRAFT_103859 [Lipomyces tetrasporus]|uniref:Uncharacterized protein n=1 Tax=Lipomyces tetrasporus TaxID=54092 RepID=A0AAD7QRY8_9ASCO|nr:uncharacterized protein POJ06DRAFT_103859 [Lipomyces tetrasporus]KAJ8100407.1 hypothetical protein POJ06DRAFT_103859 [Lipomyces tetrasporus]
MTRQSPVHYKTLQKMQRLKREQDELEKEKTSPVPVEEVIDEKAALEAEAAQTTDIKMNDAPVEETAVSATETVDDATAARGVSPTTTPSATSTPAYYDTPAAVQQTGSYQSKGQVSMTRRLALANLPPITPVTTRSKERAAASADANDDRNLPPEDQGVPNVPIDLDSNTDYIALSSTLELLTSQRETASEDIAKLQRLKLDALDDPDGFIAKLKTEGKVDGAPKMQSIVRAPVVRWSKYGISNPVLEKEIEKGVVSRDTRFGAVRVFGDPPGQRKAGA